MKNNTCKCRIHEECNICKTPKRGFGSPKYDKKKAQAAQMKGAKAKVSKGLAKMSPEKRREIASKGSMARKTSA